MGSGLPGKKNEQVSVGTMRPGRLVVEVEEEVVVVVEEEVVGSLDGPLETLECVIQCF